MLAPSLMEQFPIYEFLQDFDLPYTIYNRGIGGYTTQELLENMDVCIYALKPAYIGRIALRGQEKDHGHGNDRISVMLMTANAVL